MQCEPATSLISRLGGLTKVAGLCGVNISTVQRWRMERDKGGTGGFIPHWHARRLLEVADESGVTITASDFLPSNSATAEPTGQGSAV